MKILHFSDTHLGFSDLEKVSPEGVNRREQDFYDAFAFVIDKALESRPDLIIHTGDFFHRASPPNRPLIFALEQLRRLSDVSIPLVVIAGNHSTPKTIATSPILRAFRTFRHVYPAFSQQFEVFEFGKLAVHAFPHINDRIIQLDLLKKLGPRSGKINILMLHTSIGKKFMMDEYGEQIFPDEFTKTLEQFDYIALGHWHNFQKVSGAGNAWYCGSTERMSESEADSEKGFFFLDTTELGKPKFHPVPARPWFRIEVKDCSGKSESELAEEYIRETKKLGDPDSILTLKFRDLLPDQAIAHSNRRILETIPGFFYVHIRREYSGQAAEPGSIVRQTESIENLLQGFIHKEIDNKPDADRLSQIAREYLHSHNLEAKG